LPSGSIITICRLSLIRGSVDVARGEAEAPPVADAGGDAGGVAAPGAADPDVVPAGVDDGAFAVLLSSPSHAVAPRRSPPRARGIAIFKVTCGSRAVAESVNGH
jgi:hypothetical protein